MGSHGFIDYCDGGGVSVGFTIVFVFFQQVLSHLMFVD